MHVEGDCETTYLTHSLALTGKLGCECSRYVCTDRKWDRQKNLMVITEKKTDSVYDLLLKLFVHYSHPLCSHFEAEISVVEE